MTSTLVALRFDANAPGSLARFWAEALGWERNDAADGTVRVVATDGTPVSLCFFATSEAKVGKNPIHLDLTTTSFDDQTETVRKLIGLGGRPADVGQGPDDPHVVLADPEGNELCVIEPGNSFLAGCGRLGSITCDGSRDVGCFWSEALGWPLVWDQDEETAVRAPEGTGPFITWGPPVPPKGTKSRLHLEIAPAGRAGLGGLQAEVDRLVARGATRLDEAESSADRLVLADPDGNRFGVLSPAAARVRGA